MLCRNKVMMAMMMMVWSSF